ncbi:hypothetical protein Tco_0973180 [Tanacetum coccineum]
MFPAATGHPSATTAAARRPPENFSGQYQKYFPHSDLSDLHHHAPSSAATTATTSNTIVIISTSSSSSEHHHAPPHHHHVVVTITSTTPPPSYDHPRGAFGGKPPQQGALVLWLTLEEGAVWFVFITENGVLVYMLTPREGVGFGGKPPQQLGCVLAVTAD